MSLHSEDRESYRRKTTQNQKDHEEFDLAKISYTLLARSFLRREIRKHLPSRSDDKPPRNWFQFMLSYPVQKHMSSIELFTQWSALLLYFPLGVLSVCDPKATGKIFGIKSGKYGDGMARLSGTHSVVIAFLYLIFSRASPSISSKCIILATVFERIVIVNVLLFCICWQQLLPVEFLLAIMVMDTGLSIITIVLWFRESEVASLGKFFTNISQLMPVNKPMLHYSSRAVQILGLVQMIIGCFMVSFPNLSNRFLFSIDLDSHSRGLLSICYFVSTAIGFIHFVSGGADNKAYNVASVFYRLVFTIPGVVFLGMSSQIPFGIMGYFVSLDVVSLLFILLSFCIDFILY